MQARAGALGALLVAAIAGGTCGAAAAVAGRVQGDGPVAKVVSLLREMKQQVEKEVAEDKEAYDKYACWCETNRGKKTEAVAEAEKRISQLESFVEEAAGLEGQLKTEIGELEKGIAEDQDALETATALKKKETGEFQAVEKDSMETLSALKQAIEVLSKVQLLQRRKGGAAPQEVRPLLLQLREAVRGIDARLGAYRGVMQRDLWDVMSSIGEAAGAPEGPSADFLATGGGRRAGGGRLSALEQRGRLSVGEAQPSGAAAGASSYSAQSSGVFGILSEMQDQFQGDLGADQKAELQALIGYQKLRAAKESEIAAASSAKEQKEQALADTLAKAAQAKEDLDATVAALAADQVFLLGLEKNCKANDEGFTSRTKMRAEELRALAEAIKILSEDDARDLFGKTVSLLQLGSSRSVAVARSGGSAVGRAGAEADAARNRAIDGAMKHLLQVARKHHNWILASLAVRVRLDAFTEVLEAIDKMTADLKAQQKAESDKKDFCNQDIDQTEDGLKTKGQEKDDLEAKQLGLENTVATLSADIEQLQSEVADTQVSLKQAGEDRKAENLLFQQSIADQRATINILEKAKDRLAKFYTPSPGALAQVRGRGGAAAAAREEPGAPVAAPPPTPQAYAKSGGAGGVLQLLDLIVSGATREEAVLLKDEQSAQANYAQLARDASAVIQADSASIMEKSKLMEEAAAAKADTAASLLSNGEELLHLGDTLKGMHLDCDFVLKYYDIRQQARGEELEAIAQAKAILSGADFGKVPAL